MLGILVENILGGKCNSEVFDFFFNGKTIFKSEELFCKSGSSINDTCFVNMTRPYTEPNHWSFKVSIMSSDWHGERALYGQRSFTSCYLETPETELESSACDTETLSISLGLKENCPLFYQPLLLCVFLTTADFSTV